MNSLGFFELIQFLRFLSLKFQENHHSNLIADATLSNEMKKKLKFIRVFFDHSKDKQMFLRFTSMKFPSGNLITDAILSKGNTRIHLGILSYSL